MEAETLTISLPRNLSNALAERARRSGRDAAEYVEDLIERDICNPSLDEMLAPFRQEFGDSGMTDDELDELVEEIRDDIYREKLAASERH
jgi:hypothetical protein